MPTCDELATKAELQELRDQLNAVLGEKEDGSKVTLFTKGASNPVVQAGAGLTLLGMAKNVAPKAVVDILMEGRPTGTTWQQLASADTGIKAKFGNGTTGSLAGVNAIANTAGSGAGVASAGSKVAGGAAGATFLLASLVQMAGTLTLNKATVDILDKRIEAEASGARQALDQQNSTMLRLYEKNQEDIGAVNADIENQRAIIVNTQQQITIAQSDISQLNSQTSDIYSKLEDANQTIYQLQVQNAEAAQEINQLETELETAKAELLTAVNQVETQLDAALVIIETMKADIEAQDQRIVALEATTYEIQSRMQVYEIENRNLWDAVQDLRDDLDAIDQETEEEIQLREIKSKLTSAKLIIEQHRAKLNKGGGDAFATSQAAIAQSGVLKLTDKLGNPNLNLEPVSTTITKEDLQNDPQTFRDRFKQLLDRINPDAMTPEQIADLRTGITTGVSTDLTALFGSMIIPRLDNIADATSEPKIAQGVQTGICKSLNGGSCPATPAVPNPVQGLGGMNDSLNAKLNVADLAQGAAILGYVKNTNEAVRHAKYGLEAVQGFADIAWKATHADKAINALTLVASLHNAAMLSRNLGETLGDLTSQALSTIGVKTSEGEPLNINAALGKTFSSLMTSILGAEVYTGVKETWNKSSRIISSASQIVWTVRSIADSAREVTEWTAENTGKIGNALKKFRVVGENAYKWMPEKVTSTNKWMRKVDKFKEGVGSLDDAASSFSSALGEIQNIQQESGELMEQGDKFRENVKLAVPKEREDNDPVKDARRDERLASKSPSNQADVFRGEGETE